MCGIAGILGRQYEDIGVMLDRLAHRGPDNSHYELFHENRLALGHTRLKIIDLHERSNQPFRSPCGNYFLTFNGEIYNYRVLKRELEASGQTFVTESDTEVLLHWLIAHGDEGINRLDGSFAFAFYDIQNRTLLCARDHLGEKPFFYHSSNTSDGLTFILASEIKALLALVVPRKINDEALANYLRFLYVPAPHTMFGNIKELPPAHFLKVNLVNSTVTIHRYYNLSEHDFSCHKDLSYHDTVDLFYDTMLRTMETRMISDVPVGLLLSGGLDSNAILAFITELGQGDRIHPYTAAYRGNNSARGGDESALALLALEHQGIKGQVLEFGENFNISESLDLVSKLFDQPYGNSTALVAFQLFAAVSSDCRVALVGDGGDEILAGYPRHKAIAYRKYFDVLPQPLVLLILRALNHLPEEGRFAVVKRRARVYLENLAVPMADAFLNWSSYLSSHQMANFLADSDVETPFFSRTNNLFSRFDEDPLRAASLVDLSSFVPYNLLHGSDTVGMANSLEVRTPFLAKELVELTLSVSSGHKISSKRNKPILSDAIGNLVPNKILRQPKRPFNPPLQGLLSRNVEWIKDDLGDKDAALYSHLAYDAVNEEFEAFQSRKKDNSTFLWGLLVLNKWLQKNNL
jgi:asparagine synthase (glutamine-hydrolysing)